MEAEIMEAAIAFTWLRERNPRDYKVVKAPRSGRSGKALLDESPTSIEADRIVALRKCLDRYRPLEEFPSLWERFSKIETAEDVIEFVRNFGPLTKAGLSGKGDIIEGIRSDAENMQAGTIGGPVELYARIDNGQLSIRPVNLLHALWVQYMETKSRGHAIRCPQCNQLFATGPEAGRRRGAKFCSDECRARYNSLARSRH